MTIREGDTVRWGDTPATVLHVAGRHAWIFTPLGTGWVRLTDLTDEGADQ